MTFERALTLALLAGACIRLATEAVPVEAVGLLLIAVLVPLW